MTDPVGITRGLLDKEGVGEWEIFHQVSENFKVEIKDGKVDSLHKARVSGLAVRVLKDRKLGFSYTSALDSKSLEKTVQTATAMLKFMQPDTDTDLAEPSPMPDLTKDIYRDSLQDSPEAEKTELARSIERIARQQDKRITTIRKAGYTDAVTTLRLVNSLGLDESGKAGFVRAWIELMAEENGDQEMAYWMEQARSPLDVDPKSIAMIGARRAVDSLGGKVIPSASMPVVMENTVAAEILEILSNSFIGENHFKKTASPKIQPGQAIFSSKVSIVDDGLDPRGDDAFPFDGEGTPSLRTIVCG